MCHSEEATCGEPAPSEVEGRSRTKPTKRKGKEKGSESFSLRTFFIRKMTLTPFLCDGLVEMIIKERKIQPIVTATGGMADIFCCYSKYINKIDKDLILKGLYLIFSKKFSISLDL